MNPNTTLNRLRSWLLAACALAAPTLLLGAAGDLDTGFTPTVDLAPLAIAQQADGKIMAAGTFQNANGETRRILRLNLADGTTDATFANPASINGFVRGTLIQGDGKIIVTGDFQGPPTRLARFNPDGTLDSGFASVAINGGVVHCSTLQPDGKIIIAGSFNQVNGVPTTKIARINSNGTVDNTFAATINAASTDAIFTVAVEGSGKIVIGGNFAGVSGNGKAYLARLSSTGALDSSIVDVPDATVNCVSIQADGKILAAGDFNNVGASPRLRIARYNSDGTLDAAFAPSITGGSGSIVNSMTLQANGQILISGDFTAVNSTTRARVARLNADGSLDSLNPNANARVSSITLQSDGSILAGGNFSSIGGGSRLRFGRVANNAPSEALSLTSPTRFEWLRGGSAPEATHVTFSFSTDGTTYTFAGVGSRITGGWELTGINNLPAAGFIRAQAYTRGGATGSSAGLVQSVVPFTRGGTVTNLTTGLVYGSVQDAVNAATAGDILQLSTGLFEAGANVTKQLTIRGTQHGVDARTGRPGASESIISFAGGGLALSADGIIIDGLVIQDQTNSNAGPGFGAGIYMAPGFTGRQIKNCIIQDNVIGMYLANTPAQQAVIQNNLIRNNTKPGPSSGTGIYTDEYTAGASVENVLIDSNRFETNGATGQGIGFSSQTAGKETKNITISNNVFAGNGRAMYAWNLQNSSIINNDILNSVWAGSADLRIFEGCANLTISGNRMTGGAGYALRASNAGSGLALATNVNFTQNSVQGYAQAGAVANQHFNGVLNASGNYFGTSTPTAGMVSGSVDFTPILELNESAPNQAVIGFQADLATVKVHALGDQSGSDGRIAEGVALVNAGGTLNIADGTYTAGATVNKTLTIRGAQWGVDARTGRPGASETIISNANGAFGLEADNIVLDGVVAQDHSAGTGAPGFGYCIYMKVGFSGRQVRNCIIQNNGIGMSLSNNSAVNPLLVTQNLIRNNNITSPPAGGHGIYTDSFVGGSPLTNISLTNNKFSGDNRTLAANINNATQVTASGNEFADGGALRLGTVTNSVVTLNTFTGFKALGSQNTGLTVTTASNSVSVTGNTFTDRKASAISASGSSNLAITGNTVLQDVSLYNINSLRAMVSLTALAGTSSSFSENSITLTGTMPAGAGVHGVEVSGNNTTVVNVTANIFNGGNSDTPGTNDSAGVSISGSGLGIPSPLVSTVTISNNFVTGFVYGIGTATNWTNNRVNITAFNNSLGGNSTKSISGPSTAPTALNASANWHGTNDLTLLAPRVSGVVDYTPWLGSGTDTDLGTAGFQGDFSTLFVGTGLSQVEVVSRIQEGINRVNTGGTVYVTAGTYAGNVSAASTAVTLEAGQVAGTAVVTVNGNLELSSNDTLDVQINGPTAGSTYDQWVVNGTVSLGGATLAIDDVYAPLYNDSFTLIANDMADAVSGTFAGLPEGTVVTVNGVTARIYYTRGTGNDVVITTIPEMDMEQPAGTALANNGSRYFGKVDTGNRESIEFTIKNTGNADLNITSATIINDADGDFTITTSPASQVGQDGTTTLVVRFAPTIVGEKSAKLRIVNNDDTENPYDVNLTGTAEQWGEGLAFDGIDDMVEIAADAAFNTPEFTIEAWVKPAAGMSAWSRIWGTQNNKGDLIAMTDGQNRFSFAPYINGSYVFATSPDPWVAGQYYHVAGVIDHQMVRLFVNGVQKAAVPYTGQWEGDAGTRFLGRTVTPAKFKGVMDEVRYWNYARNCQQIAQASVGELTGAEQGLVAYYTFNQGLENGPNAGVTVLNDLTLPQNNGTLTGFALTNGNSTSNWTTPGGVPSWILAPQPQFPEMDLYGNSLSVRDGDTTPRVADHTDFGLTDTKVTRTFTISNPGNLPLTISQIDLSGPEAAAFTLGDTGQAPNGNGDYPSLSFPIVVPGGSSTTFGVTVEPTTTDFRNATVTITNDDCEEGTFDFAIRSAPPIKIAVTGTTVVTQDTTFAGGTLTVSKDIDGKLVFSNPARSFSINGAIPVSEASDPIDLTGIESVTVNGNLGNDTIIVGAFTNFPSLTVNGGLGNDNVNFTGSLSLASGRHLNVDLQDDDATPGTDSVSVTAAVSTSGSGTVTVRASRAVAITGGAASLTTASGNLIVEANQQATATTGQFAGVSVSGGAISAGAGSVTVAGRGGSTGDANIGVSVTAGGVISATSGAVSVTGAGGQGGNNLYGVYVDGAASAVSTTGGAINLAGTGGSGTGQGSRGIFVNAGGRVLTTGSGVITLNGTGGTDGTGTRRGVHITGAGSLVSSVNGLISITGAGGTGGSGVGNRGVTVASGAEVRTTGTGGIQVQGVEGDGAAPIEGFSIEGPNAKISTAAGTGNVTIASDRIFIDGVNATIDAGLNKVTLLQRTAGRTISLAGSDDANQLGLLDNELDRITAGTLEIGDTATGTIVQVGGISRPASTAIVLTNGGSSNISLQTSTMNTAGGSLTVNPGGSFLAPAAGIDVSAGTNTLAMGGSKKMAFAINSAVVDTGYTQLKVAGQVDLAGVTLEIGGSHVPLKGQVFRIIDNDGTDQIITDANTFPANGATVTLNGVDLILSYNGGDGNDVTLGYAQPVLTATSASVTVNEGAAAVNTGTFTDLQTGYGDIANDWNATASVGTVVLNPNGTWSWSYNTTNGPANSATVLITATDEDGDTGQVSFSLVVKNVAPVAQANSVTINEDSGANPIQLVATDVPADAANDGLVYELVTAPAAAKGSVVVNSTTGVATFTPVLNANGVATFSFRATDPDGAVSNTATVTVNITPVNDKPSFTLPVISRSHSSGFSTSQTVAAWAQNINDGDPEVAQTLTFTVTPDGGTPAGFFTTPPAISSTGTLTYQTSGIFGESTLTVVLTDNGSNVSPNRNFSDSLTFTITVAEDDVKPTVTITAPAANANVPENTTNNTVTVSGSAADNKTVQKVQVKLNSGAFVDATTTVSSSGTTATYTLAVTPEPGSNTITVKSIDSKGNESLPVTRSFTYVVMRPFAVTITPANSGTVTYSPALVSGKAQIGKTYTLTATAKTGFFFDNWTGSGVTNPPVANKVTSVVFTEAMSTPGSVTANFFATPFKAGTYTGLATAAVGTTASVDTVGQFSGTLTTTGSFSAKATFAATPVSFTVVFDPKTGNVTGTASGISYNLTLDLENDTDKITGTLTTTAGTSNVDADRAAFSTTNPVPVAYRNNASTATYTVVFPARPQTPAMPLTSYPQGSGIGTITLSSTGTATLSGTLADGSAAFTYSAPLSKNFEWPLARMVKASASTAGTTLVGMVQFDPMEDDSDLYAVDLQWYRTSYPPGEYYAAGWPNGITVDAVGAIYRTTTNLQNSLGLATPAPGAWNAKLTWSRGGLSSPVEKTNFKIVGNTVTKASDTSYTITATASTGAFSGTFTPTWPDANPTKPSFKGVILQKGGNKGGYGFFLNNSLSGPDREVGNAFLGAP
jgi:uncharacterized delta-60 repeat protein